MSSVPEPASVPPQDVYRRDADDVAAAIDTLIARGRAADAEA